MRILRFISWILPFVLISCGESEAEKEVKRLKQEAYERDSLDEVRREAAIIEQKQLREKDSMMQANLQEQLNLQAERQRLETLANDEPQTLSNLIIRNLTQQGTILSVGKLFEASKVRYIGWYGDFTDNAVKLGRKTYGSIYVRYIRKIDESNDSWETLHPQGSFTTREGKTHQYTRSYNMTHDGRETYSYGNQVGTSSGGAFPIGKWKIEVYWDADSRGRAYYMKGEYFEIY